MPREDWLKAALILEKHNAEFREDVQTQVDRSEEDKPTRFYELGKIEAALDDFFSSEDWAAARFLLSCGSNFLRIAECNDGGGYGSVYYLDQGGLKVSHEAMGLWVAHAEKGSVKLPAIESLSSNQAAAGIMRASDGKATASSVMRIIREGLDVIARSVIPWA